MKGLIQRCVLPLVIAVLILPALCSAGTVIMGKVTDRGGEKPMAADVLIYRLEEGGAWSFAGSRPTNSLGEYKITFLGEGTYHLRYVHSTSCNPSTSYCADRYLEQYYNNTPLWDFENITKIVLKDGDQLVLDTTRLKVRPFYFETASNPCVPVDADGVVRITRSVVNSTGKDYRMVFWGVIDSPFRLESRQYYGMQASYTFGSPQWKVLKPGRNAITFTHRLGASAIKGAYNYWIVGGDARWLPMTPYLSGTFCYSGNDAIVSNDLMSGSGNSGMGRSAALVRAIPLKVSPSGEILESGPMPR